VCSLPEGTRRKNKIMKNENKKLIDYALKYLNSGFSVIPVGKDKKPLIKWEEFQGRKTTKEEIKDWFKSSKATGIGVVTGAISGIVVVDVEAGGDTKDLPPTVMSKTGGGGWHFFYKHPGRPVKNAVRIRDKMDIRGDGGFVVVPPSLHASGNRYEWLIALEDAGFEELPQWILEKGEGKEISKTDWQQFMTSKNGEGVRNMSASQLAGKLLHHLPTELWEVAGWVALKEWNNSQNNPPLEEKELKNVWESIKEAETKKRVQNQDIKLNLKKTKRAPLSSDKLEPEKSERIKRISRPEQEVDFIKWRETIKANFPELVFPAEYGLSIMSQILIKEITNPFSLVLVDVPSAGKTIAINFFSEIDGLTYATDKFTPASFVSNAANVSKEKLPDIDLLPRLKYKMFLLRDLSTLFSKREDDLNECLGLLTRVLDGEGLNADTGVHGQRHYAGEYLFMILAGSTPIPPKVWKMMGNLGSRLFFLSMGAREKSEEELADQITTLAYKEKELICRSITKNFLYTLWHKYPEGVDWDRNKDKKEYKIIIARCARLLAKLRGVINVWQERAEEGRVEYSYYSPVVEKPDRINQLFYNLCRGHALVCDRTQINQEDLKLIVELAIDSCPTMRARLFRKLIENNGEMRTGDVEVALQCSKPTALKEMETLKILGVCYINQDSYGEVGGQENILHLAKDFEWFLSDECKEIRDILLPPKQDTPADLL